MVPPQLPKFRFRRILIFGREFLCWDAIPEREIVRVFAKIDFREDGCWLWTAGRKGGGSSPYGCVRFCGESWGAHQAVYEILRGPIPDGIHLHHNTCKIKHCVCPDHVEPLTNSEHAVITLADRWAVRPSHCPHGHEYSELNTYWFRGRRTCRACHRINSDIYNKKKAKSRKELQAVGALPILTHNADKQVCSFGHPFSEANTYVMQHKNRAPTRQCKRCMNIHGRIAKAKKAGDREDYIAALVHWRTQPLDSTDPVKLVDNRPLTRLH